MSLYKFSPIKSKREIYKAVEHINYEAYKLCEASFGRYLSNSGNLGIFCHYDDEYDFLTGIREELTKAYDNKNQKYFRLHEPIVVPRKDNIPETIYTYLYIRKPDPYRHHVGDMDFYLQEAEYAKLKAEMEVGRELHGARLFPSPHLDMIELYNPDSDVLAYASTKAMTNTVKIIKSRA